MLWALYGLLHSLFRAAFAETGRIFKADRWHLMFLQALFGLLFILPFVPFMSWPEGGGFYLAAVAVSLILTVGQLVQLTLAAQKGGRVSSLYMLLEAGAAGVIWVAIMPGALGAYVQAPAMTAGIVLGYILAAAGVLRIRPQDANWGTLAIVAPVGATFAVAGVATKLVMPQVEIVPAALTFVLINYGIVALVMGSALAVKKKFGAGLVSGPLLKAGALTGAFSAAGYFSFVAAVSFSPNPGYVGVLAMMVPVWLMLCHKFVTREGDAARIFPALLLVAGIATLLAAATVL